MMSGLMGTVAQGFAFGTGSAVARQAVGAASDAMFGGSSAAPAQQEQASTYQAAPAAGAGACEVDKKAFYTCLQNSNGDADKCSDLFRALSMCQENAKWSSA